MTRRKLSATIRAKKPLANGFLKVNQYEFEIDTHGGGKQIVVRDVMERGNAVGVLPYDPILDVVVMVNEFRPGCLIAGDEPFTDNLVAGGIGAEESALDAAIRETKEEADLELRDPVLVHPGAYVSSGGTSEKLAIVAGIVDASGAGGIHGNEHESEDILTVVVPAEELFDRLERAQITDLKTIVAIYWLREHRDAWRQRYRSL